MDYAIKESLAKDRQCYFLAIGLKENNLLIGNVGVSLKNNNCKEAEIGWMLLPEFHGLGYATEAAALLAAYGMKTLGLTEIIATCAKQNTQSERIMMKLGMVKTHEYQKFYKQKNIELTKVQYVLK